MKQPKVRFISTHNIEHGSYRPYAALMYMGYTFLDSSIYDKAYYETKHGDRYTIHKIAVSNSSILIIYDDKRVWRTLSV